MFLSAEQPFTDEQAESSSSECVKVRMILLHHGLNYAPSTFIC